MEKSTGNNKKRSAFRVSLIFFFLPPSLYSSTNRKVNWGLTIEKETDWKISASWGKRSKGRSTGSANKNPRSYPGHRTAGSKPQRPGVTPEHLLRYDPPNLNEEICRKKITEVIPLYHLIVGERQDTPGICIASGGEVTSVRVLCVPEEGLEEYIETNREKSRGGGRPTRRKQEGGCEDIPSISCPQCQWLPRWIH